MSNALSLITKTTKVGPAATSIAGGALGAVSSVIDVGVSYYHLQKNKQTTLVLEYKNQIINERVNQLASKINLSHQELELIELQSKSILNLFQDQLEVIKSKAILNSEKEKHINEHLVWIKANAAPKEYQLALISASDYYISEII